MTILMDGKILAKQITDNLKQQIAAQDIKAGLAVVLVGNDAASKIYVQNKIKKCKAIGIESSAHILPTETTQKELLALIDKLNKDDQVNGILVQLPLPKHLDSQPVIEAIAQEKDIDGFHPENVGRLRGGMQGGFTPCTPTGCIKLIKHYIKEPLAGMHAVVLGRSHMVGKPVADLLLQENCTVTTLHSRSKNIPAIIKQADIIVAAIGQPHYVQADWVKKDAIVVDVGINRLADGRLVGDVDYENIYPKAQAITPVPGGVGPMTIACLMENCVAASLTER